MALTSDPDELIDTNVEQMLEELIQSVIGVTAWGSTLACATVQRKRNLHDDYWPQISGLLAMQQDPH